jgi:hypothetical protein
VTQTRRLAYAAFTLALFAAADARADDRTITIKSGETVELIRLYNVMNCKSISKSAPVAEILVGPPQLSLSLKEAKVLPWKAPQCKEEVPGAILSLVAGDVKEASISTIVVRWKYNTVYGATTTRGQRYIVTITPQAVNP